MEGEKGKSVSRFGVVVRGINGWNELKEGSGINVYKVYVVIVQS